MLKPATTALAGALMLASANAGADALRQITLEEVIGNWSSSLEARWRDLGQDTNAENNLYLAAPGIAPPPDAQAIANPIERSGTRFALSYSDTAFASMSLGNDAVATFDYSADPNRPGRFNDVLIKLRTPNRAAGMTLDRLELDGTPLTPARMSNTVGGELFWLAEDVIEADAFALSGRFSATGLTGSNEANRFEIAVGNYGSPVPLPAAAWLFGSALVAVGLLGARRKNAS
jgi:hypothetical protein